MLDLSELTESTVKQFREATRIASSEARYTGSAYHRSSPREGPIAQRIGLTSRCPPNWTNIEATRVLRIAIGLGRVSERWENGFPRYVWHLDDDVLYEARLTNSGTGELWIPARRSMAMAEEFPIKSFAVDLQWPANPGKGGYPLLDESLARFQIAVGGKPITAYQTDQGAKHTYLPVPTYYLVEWLAQNWWSFLYEPRKNDREDAEQDYRTRHWLGTARSGFALPDVTFSPVGEKIEILARSAYLRFAQLNFFEAASSFATTECVRSEFSKFINQVLIRLTENGATNTSAHKLWEQVTRTTSEEEFYCRMIGSMGLSPYVTAPRDRCRFRQGLRKDFRIHDCRPL